MIETVRQAEEGEESEEEGLPEDPNNDNVEAQALFELEVEEEQVLQKKASKDILLAL